MPNGRASDLTDVGADWNAYSAVMTVHSERVRGGRTVVRELAFNMTRKYQRDRAWHTVLEPIADPGRTGAGEDRRAWLSRTEIGPDGGRSFDGYGKEIVNRGFDFNRPSDSTLAAHPEIPRLPALPKEAPAPVAGHRAESREAWADRMLADHQSGDRARARFARAFGGEAMHTERGLRYSRLRGERQLQLLADSVTGVPLEVTQTRAGALEFHVVHSYERRSDGRAILRETRFERPDAGGDGLVVIRTRYDAVKFSREGTGQ